MVTQDLDGEIVVHLYDREDLAIMLDEVDAAGATTLESEERSDFDATVGLSMETDVVTGTVTVQGDDVSR